MMKFQSVLMGNPSQAVKPEDGQETKKKTPQII